MPEANSELSAAPPLPEKSDVADAQKAAAEAQAAAIGEELQKRISSERQTPKQVPSMGRNVIVRSGGKCAPGIVAEVREDGSIDVQIFRADHMVHAGHSLTEVGPDAESGDGWFWPPRV